MICPTCGVALPDPAHVCMRCAHALPQKERVPERLGVLICVDNPEIRFFVQDRAIIGRSSRGTGPVDIDLKGIPGAEYVSRQHAEIYREGDAFWIRDLQSTNGTFVNGEGPIQQPRKLENGTRIRLASLAFEFRIEESS